MIELDMAVEKAEIKSALLIGPEGSGKTALMGTAPLPMMVFSTDKGYKTLAGVPGIKVKVFVEEDRRQPKAWKEFEAEFKKFMLGKEMYTWPDGRQEPYKSVGLDSFTHLNRFQMYHAAMLNSCIEKIEGYGVWGQLKQYGIDTLEMCMKSGLFVVVTVLVATEKDEDTGKMWFLPQTEGSVRECMGDKFDLVGYLEVDKRPGAGGTVTKVHRMHVVGENRQRAKLRIPAAFRDKVPTVFENANLSGLLEMYDKLSKGAAAGAVATPAVVGK